MIFEQNCGYKTRYKNNSGSGLFHLRSETKIIIPVHTNRFSNALSGLVVYVDAPRYREKIIEDDNIFVLHLTDKKRLFPMKCSLCKSSCEASKHLWREKLAQVGHSELKILRFFMGI